MADNWSLSSARFATIFPKLLTGINVRNRFVYISNICDQMFKTSPSPLEELYREACW